MASKSKPQLFHQRLQQWRARDGLNAPSLSTLAITVGFPGDALRNTLTANRVDRLQEWTEGFRCASRLEDLYHECGGTQEMIAKVQEGNGGSRDVHGPTKRARASDDAAGDDVGNAVASCTTVAEPQLQSYNALQPPGSSPAHAEAASLRAEEIVALQAKVAKLEEDKQALAKSVELLTRERDATKVAAAAAVQRKTTSANTATAQQPVPVIMAARNRRRGGFVAPRRTGPSPLHPRQVGGDP